MAQIRPGFLAGPGRLTGLAGQRMRRRAAARVSWRAAVMQVLWDAGQALSPGKVWAALDGGAGRLSYSTVVTILSGLRAKKAVVRQRAGRAFRYSPAADEAGSLPAADPRPCTVNIPRADAAAIAPFAVDRATPVSCPMSVSQGIFRPGGNSPDSIRLRSQAAICRCTR